MMERWKSEKAKTLFYWLIGAAFIAAVALGFWQSLLRWSL
jgi:hypothetical protein